MKELNQIEKRIIDTELYINMKRYFEGRQTEDVNKKALAIESKEFIKNKLFELWENGQITIRFD